MKIHVKLPTRVDLAGGTLDCWPLYNLIDHPCYTINLSISVFTEVFLQRREDQKVVIEMENLNYQKEFSSLEDCLNSPDQELLFLKPHFNYWEPQAGFELKTSSQSPVGGGLGGSSSLCMGLVRTFSQFCETPMELLEMVTLGSNIEAQILKTPTGTQDYYPALRSGLNLIEYDLRGPRWTSLSLDEEVFKNQMLLVYTGKPHHSGINNWQVIKAAVEGDRGTLDGLTRIAQIASEMKEVCFEQRWEELPRLFGQEYEARTQLSPSFTSPEIQRLEKLALGAGADAVKICGAGGGGCVIVWSSPENQVKLREECEKNQFQVLKAHPVVQ